MLTLTTKTINYAKNTINNLNSERYTMLVLEVIELREEGHTYDAIDDMLGLDIGTPNSCYALMKQQAAKAIYRKLMADRAANAVVEKVLGITK